MKKIIGNPSQKNKDLINLINKTKINHYYIKNYEDFRDRIIKNISSEDVVLDCGKAMREKFQDILGTSPSVPEPSESSKTD